VNGFFICSERIFHMYREDFSFLPSRFSIFTELIFHFFWADFPFLQSGFFILQSRFF
jgi:hypothetical protein